MSLPDVNTDHKNDSDRTGRFMPGKETILSLWLICAVMISIVLIAPRAASPDNMLARYVDASIDEKISTTLELSAGSSAASMAVSAFPGDTATPLAEKLADFGGGFLVVLCALYFEKLMFRVLGYLLFMVILPVSLLLLVAHLLKKKEFLRNLACCLMLSGILLWLMIPASLRISDMVYETNRSTIESTIAASGDLSMEIEENTEEDGSEASGAQGSSAAPKEAAGSGEDPNLVQRIFSTVSTIGGETLQKARNLITSFLQALALMIVTACVIPIVIILLFLWAIRMIFRFGLFGWRPLPDEDED